MSDMETHIGKLRRIMPLDENETVEQIMYRLLTVGREKINPEKDILWNFEMAFGDKYHVFNNYVFKMDDYSFEDDEDSKITENPDGSLDYFFRFYNGGCGMTEALDDVLSRHFKEKKND